MDDVRHMFGGSSRSGRGDPGVSLSLPFWESFFKMKSFLLFLARRKAQEGIDVDHSRQQQANKKHFSASGKTRNIWFSLMT